MGQLVEWLLGVLKETLEVERKLMGATLMFGDSGPQAGALVS